MEEQKTTDKRKAPDKDDSLSEIDTNSVIKQPVKRARIDDKVTVVSGQVPAAGEIEDTEKRSPSNDDNPLSKSVGEVIQVNLTKETGAETGAVVLDEREQLGPEINLPALKNGKDSTEVTRDEPIIRKAVDNSIEDQEMENNNSFSPGTRIRKDFGDDSGDIHPLSGDSDTRNGEQAESGIQVPKTQDVMSSSPMSEIDKGFIPSEVNISIKAFDVTSYKLIYDAPCIRTTFVKLEEFLNFHKLSMTQSINSGYLADIDSQEHVFHAPSHSQTNYSRKGRWTSSTLGSSIPRESIKTVYTLSPNESPTLSGDEAAGPKKRGKKSPKMSSTKIELKNSPSPKKGKSSDNAATINGPSTSNGVTANPETTRTPKSAKRNWAKSVKTGSKSSPSSSDTSAAPNKTAKNTPSSTSTTTSSKQQPKTPKSVKSRTVSREFSGILSPLPTLSAIVEASPARAVAIVEGNTAKPMTKFEREVNNEPVDLGSLSLLKTVWAPISPGTPVYARWSDKNYYSGIVTEKGLNDTWKIDFDDNTSFPASEGHCLPIKILGVGFKGVYCPDSGYHPADAVVLGQKTVKDPEIGETVKYAIKLIDGGQVLWCTRRMLSVKENEAKVLKLEYQNQPMAKVFKAADISFENVLPPDSTRRRAAASANTSMTMSTPQSISTTLTPVKQRKLLGDAFDASTADESMNESKSTPKSAKKKTTQPKLNKKKEMSTSSPTRSTRDFSFNSDASTGPDKSPAKESPKRLKGNEKKLFEGYQFFLTASGGGDPASLGHSSASSPSTYDKDEYRERIEKRGGKIIETVDKVEKTKKDRTFLISDNYARTVKYIYCLAASVPCVSYLWIQECISQNTITPWKKSELNAGWSLEEGKIILPHKQKPLKDFRVYITAGSDDLYNYWKPVLTAAQAKLLKPISKKGRENDIPEDANVLVTDNTCSKEVLAKAHERMLPVVKPEWLVQTIIGGKKADFFSNEKYRVEVIDDEHGGESSESDSEENEEETS